MPQPTRLVDTKGLSREDWLKYRRQGIGGSDAPCIIGVSPYKGALGVFLEKTGEITDEIEQNDGLRFGTLFEDIVAREWAKDKGWKVAKCNAIMQHPEHEFMLANVDRIYTKPDGTRGILEVKTTGMPIGLWEDKALDSATIQNYHYQTVMGLTEGFVVVLVMGQTMYEYPVNADEATTASLIQIESDFWEAVVNRTPPAIDASKDTADILKFLYPTAENASVMEVTEEVAALAEAYLSASEQEKLAKLEKDTLGNKLRDCLGTTETAIGAGLKISWKNQVTNRFQAKEFEAAHPNLYAEYTKPCDSRVLRVTRAKE